MKMMKFGITYNQGEIVIVPFPFSDLSGIRKRSVLIISKNEDNIVFDDIITCGITSNIKNVKYSVEITNDNLEKGEIPVKSRIKVDKLFTLNQSIVKKKIAKIDKITLDKVKEEFCSLVM